MVGCQWPSLLMARADCSLGYILLFFSFQNDEKNNARIKITFLRILEYRSTEADMKAVANPPKAVQLRDDPDGNSSRTVPNWRGGSGLIPQHNDSTCLGRLECINSRRLARQKRGIT